MGIIKYTAADADVMTLCPLGTRKLRELGPCKPIVIFCTSVMNATIAIKIMILRQ